jgi:hypothetical protein
VLAPHIRPVDGVIRACTRFTSFAAVALCLAAGCARSAAHRELVTTSAGSTVVIAALEVPRERRQFIAGSETLAHQPLLFLYDDEFNGDFRAGDSSLPALALYEDGLAIFSRRERRLAPRKAARSLFIRWNGRDVHQGRQPERRGNACCVAGVCRHRCFDLIEPFSARGWPWRRQRASPRSSRNRRCRRATLHSRSPPRRRSPHRRRRPRHQSPRTCRPRPPRRRSGSQSTPGFTVLRTRAA